jgi:hypothetical protein
MEILALGLAGESLPLRTDENVKAHLAGGPLVFLPTSRSSGSASSTKQRLPGEKGKELCNPAGDLVVRITLAQTVLQAGCQPNSGVCTFLVLNNRTVPW